MAARLPTKIAFLASALLALGSCGDAQPESSAVSVRDSSGIRVVASRTPAWADGVGAWRVDSVPLLSLGERDGPRAVQFFRLADATRREDGTLVVANSGTGELRFFDSGGRFLRAAGRHGAGPGEFAQFSGLRICAAPGGLLRVEDGGNDRINVFSTTGEYVRTVRLEPAGAGGPPGIVGCFRDGRLLGISWPSGKTLGGRPGEIIEGELHYIVVDRDGRPGSTVAEVSTRPRFVNRSGGVVHYPFIPLTPQPSVAPGSDRVYVAAGGEAAVEARDGQGELVAIYRWEGLDPRAVEDVWPRYREESLEAIPREDQRRRYARFFAQDLPLPEHVPAVQGLLADPEGNLWVERYRLPWEGQREWDILDPEGRWLGSLTFPGAFAPLEIGDDHVLGRTVDELGVERLVMLRLVK